MENKTMSKQITLTEYEANLLWIICNNAQNQATHGLWRQADSFNMMIAINKDGGEKIRDRWVAETLKETTALQNIKDLLK